MNSPLAAFKKESTSVGAFNADAYHAMQARDDQLTRDSILHGYTGKEYVYSFNISGKQVTGVSVVGARELASYYGGIKSRIVASVDKTGALFVFKSFEPLAIQAQMIPQLSEEPDFYEVVMEITDLKTGNSLQVRKKESKTERRSNGTPYDRPHYDVIAESKAYRNGVLSIIPQNVIAEFEKRALAAGNNSQEKTIDQLRSGILGFAAKSAIALERLAVNELLYAEISGLGTAANQGVEAFREAAASLGILVAQPMLEHGEEKSESATPTPAPTPTPAKSTQTVKAKAQPQPTETKSEEKQQAAVFTYGDVASALKTSKTIDDLNESADLIRSVANEVHRTQLNAIYDECAAKLNGADPL